MLMVISAFIIASLLIALSLIANRARLKKSFKIKLQTNCLMTKYPIVFISSVPSVFYFGNYWNYIPEILTEHGYDVIELNFKNKKDLLTNLQSNIKALKAHYTNVHIIGDFSIKKLLQKKLNNRQTLLDQLWTIETQSTNRPQKTKSKNTFYLSTVNPQTHFIWRVLIFFHNHLLNSSLSPVVVGLTDVKSLNSIAFQYLKLANLLAESDYKCSNF